METGRKVCTKLAGSGRRKGGRERRPKPRVADGAVGCRDGGRMIGSEGGRKLYKGKHGDGGKPRVAEEEGRGCSMEVDIAGLMQRDEFK